MEIVDIKSLRAVSLGAVALVLAGCHHSASTSSVTSTDTQSPSGSSEMQIAVIPKGTSHEYWKSIHAGAIKAQMDLAKQGTQFSILWKGTEREDDRNGQHDIVETFVSQKVNGILLAPLDSQALVTPVLDAVNNKIPVVIMDSSLKGNDWSSFVATNNERGGELAGKELAKLLGGTGKVILLPYEEGSASTEQRELGFTTALKNYPGITIVSSNQYGGPSSNSAYTASQNILQRFGRDVQGVFASNESNTQGMRLALRDAGLLKKVKFIGFDSSADLLQGLRAGEIQALIVQNPFKMGDVGVKTLIAVIKGKVVPKNIDTGVSVVTTQNMSDPAMQQLLNPPIDQYLK